MNIAILTGGISTEREVALRSAANMKNWCENSGHTVIVYDVPGEIDLFLGSYNTFDNVIPMLHGRYGEDGTITGMCEALGVPIAGCSSQVHALCIDKNLTNTIVASIGIRVPLSWIPGTPPPRKLLIQTGEEKLKKSLIVKPNQGGSSFATTKAHTISELQEGILEINQMIFSLGEKQKELLKKDNQEGFHRRFPSLEDVPLIQECIEGREFTVGVYRDSSGYHTLPIVEIRTLAGEFFDYKEKYETDGSNELFMTHETELQNRLSSESLKISEFIGIRGIVRIDWRYDGKNIFFLEVNTIPGFTSASLVPKMWKKAGKSEKEFVEMLCLS